MIDHRTVVCARRALHIWNGRSTLLTIRYLSSSSLRSYHCMRVALCILVVFELSKHGTPQPEACSNLTKRNANTRRKCSEASLRNDTEQHSLSKVPNIPSTAWLPQPLCVSSNVVERLTSAIPRLLT